jgi:hypothetical protein
MIRMKGGLMRTSSPKSSQCPVLLVADFDVHCIACYLGQDLNLPGRSESRVRSKVEADASQGVFRSGRQVCVDYAARKRE